MDPQEFRALGHQVVDELADYLDSIEDRRVFPDVDPRHLESIFDESLPEAPSPGVEILREIREKLLPNCVHTGHGGYLGLITSSPLPIGMIGDLIASGINQNLRNVLDRAWSCLDRA